MEASTDRSSKRMYNAWGVVGLHWILHLLSEVCTTKLLLIYMHAADKPHAFPLMKDYRTT